MVKPLWMSAYTNANTKILKTNVLGLVPILSSIGSIDFYFKILKVQTQLFTILLSVFK